MSVSIAWPLWRAAVLATAPVADAKAWLQSWGAVLVEVSDGLLRLVATDRRLLVAVDVELDGGGDGLGAAVSAADLATVVKPHRGAKWWAQLERSPDVHLRVHGGPSPESPPDVTFTLPGASGTFPPTRPLFNLLDLAAAPLSDAHLNPLLLGRLCTSARAAGIVGSIQLHPPRPLANGKPGPLLAEARTESIHWRALLMPVLVEEPPLPKETP